MYVSNDVVTVKPNSYSKYKNGSFHQLISIIKQSWTMTELDSKSEISVEGDTILSKIGKLTTANSPRLPSIKDFSIIKIISRGAFGQVFLGYKNTDESKLFAIKVMRKSEMVNKNMISQVITERNVLALSTSEYCVHLYYSLQTPFYVFLVMEYMIGGDLKSLIAAYGYFCESAAQFYCAEITMALEYLHKHGIIHRDIKPDNMLLSTSGHVKLTDFGLSKIEISRDLELSDFMASSPCLTTRTPGQLLSLTSHLTFGSGEPKYRNRSTADCAPHNLMNAINRQKSPDVFETSIHTNNVSGISPFFSSEDINESINVQPSNDSKDSASSYYTCNSSIGSRTVSRCDCSQLSANVSFRNMMKERKCDICKNKENVMNNDSLKYPLMKMRFARHLKENEDSGISSLRSNIHCELSAIEKCENLSHNPIKEDSTGSSSNLSKSSNNSNHDTNNLKATESPLNKSMHKSFFKRPCIVNGAKRLHHTMNGPDDACSQSTGLTQEIDIMDIGSSTPKRKKSKSPLKGVLKIRALSDDEAPATDHSNGGAHVIFSTPVSSQKTPRNSVLKLKATRFQLPTSEEKMRNKNTSILAARYLNEPAMSPINSANIVDGTPKVKQTPFRTPKSVRRNQAASSERILGTPDYLSPELLLSQKHGAAVDWWSLGVCLFEFMTGIPPFNDETPQQVFENILNRNIQWDQADEPLSAEAIDAVEQLLTMDPNKRPSSKEVKQMMFFKSIDWNNLPNTEPPFVPHPENPTDTGYFEPRNIMQHLKLSNIDIGEFVRD